MSKAEQKVIDCINYIQSFFPNNKIVFVIFSKESQWLFIDENLETPEFPSELDTAVIEETMDEVYLEFGLPYQYMIN